MQLTSLNDELERKQAIIKQLDGSKNQNEILSWELKLRENQLKKVMNHYESKMSKKTEENNE